MRQRDRPAALRSLRTLPPGPGGGDEPSCRGSRSPVQPVAGAEADGAGHPCQARRRRCHGRAAAGGAGAPARSVPSGRRAGGGGGSAAPTAGAAGSARPSPGVAGLPARWGAGLSSGAVPPATPAGSRRGAAACARLAARRECAKRFGDRHRSAAPPCPRS